MIGPDFELGSPIDHSTLEMIRTDRRIRFINVDKSTFYVRTASIKQVGFNVGSIKTLIGETQGSSYC